MEAHRGTHAVRGWRGFAAEFLMIAIAVFVGSMGEYFLEHKIIEERRDDGLALMLRILEADRKNIDEIVGHCDRGIAHLDRSKMSAFRYKKNKISRDEYFRLLADDIDNRYSYRTLFLDRTAFNSMSSVGLVSLIESPELKIAISNYYEVLGRRLDDNNKLVDTEARQYYYESFLLKNATDDPMVEIPGKLAIRFDASFYLSLPIVIEKTTSDRFITDTDNLLIRVVDYRSLLRTIRAQNEKVERLIRQHLES